MNELKSRTFVFYPEFEGMNGATTTVFMFLLIGAFMVFLPETANILGSELKINSIILYMVGCVSFLLSVILYSGMKVKVNSTKYFLTENKLVVESGFTSKTISNLDLKRVIDLELKQTTIQNFFDDCVLIIYSSDVTDPVLKIKGLNFNHAKNIFKLLTFFVGLQNPSSESKEVQQNNIAF